MTDPLSRELSRTSWPRPLTPAERAALNDWLAAHPEAREEWVLEQALNERLALLKNTPVPTNFTARVLDAVTRDDNARARRPSGQRWSWRWLFPGAATTALAVAIGLFAYAQHRGAERTERAHNVAALSAVAPVPSPEVLRNMEIIRQLETPLEADVELIALFQ